MITADDLRQRLATLEPIGLQPTGTTRLPWTEEDAQSGRWFAAQAEAAGLRVQRDPAGNRWAVPGTPGPWWAVGSHLDSVRDGGRFDGALGVAAAFAVAARAARPVAVISFADEEGTRFNTPTFGSRALTGVADLGDVLNRVDQDGVGMAAAMRAAGVDPDGVHRAPAWLEHLRGFVELHIDQSRDVHRAGVPFAVVRGLAARLRLAVVVHGAADHAGTTAMDERSDAMAVAARIIVAALDLAGDQLRVTPGRVLVEPNALTTIAARACVRIDARGPSAEALASFERELTTRAAALAQVGRTDVEVRAESRSAGIAFDAELRAALRGPGGHETLCFAGHDAGLIAPCRPAAMVLVRNPTGVSHSPDESVDLSDAAAGATRILEVVEELG
ncbi:MAG: hypothetical protein JWO02_3314 [Solirubrobacterales bacterium]|nr:hypothetical protein [Solirubrobacterales bacterium]